MEMLSKAQEMTELRRMWMYPFNQRVMYAGFSRAKMLRIYEVDINGKKIETKKES